MPSGMNILHAIRSFIRTADAGSLAAAARTLGISAAAVGQNIARLEAHLGVRLFNRTTRSVTPTAAGERLLERLRPALEEIHAAFNDLDDESQRPVGTLKLNVPIPVARFVLPDLLSRRR